MRTIAYFATLGILLGMIVVSYAYNLPVDARGDVVANSVLSMKGY